jgi:hypothetical protein
MIEFSLTEIALFCWAVLATAYALKCKAQTESADLFIRVLLERKDVRDKLVADYEEFKESVR